MQINENPSRSPGRTIADVLVILLLVAAVVAIAAHAPSTTYAYAQLQQIGANVGTIESGDLLLPRDQMGGLARKGQLYAWVAAPVHIITDVYNDFTFRLPTVLCSLVMGVLVYVAGRRWYGRGVGLMAACLWAVMHHMSKLMYVAVTDMMLAVWVTGAILCADRLLFHRAPRGKRGRWAVGLWVMMIGGAMTKGWGVLNFIIVGGALALATAAGPGFGAIRAADGIPAKAMLVLRLIGRRWRRAMRATHFGVGLLATAAVLAPLWWGMFGAGGEEFRQIVQFEFVARITGGGEITPHGTSIPRLLRVLYLLYYMLPVTFAAVVAMVLVRPRKWLAGSSPLALPLCWILAVLAPFSLTHGFRPDYLLPCYAAGALMGAWAIETVRRRGQAGGAKISWLRHVIAAPAVVVPAGLALLAAAYLFHQHLGGAVAKALPLPPGDVTRPETWWIVAALIPIGAAGLAVAIWASLTWRLRALTAVLVVAMLGVMFMERHFITRHARTGDGERLMQFAVEARGRIDRSEPFAVARTEKLGTELYFGRFGRRVLLPETIAEVTIEKGAAAARRAVRLQAASAVEQLNDDGVRWLITCDRGLVELGAFERDKAGPVVVKLAGGKCRVRTHPRRLGNVLIATEPIVSQGWGRVYLIELDLPLPDMSSKARGTGNLSGRRDSE